MKPQIKPELLSWLCLVTLALIWGVNFIFIKISVEDVGPTTNVFFRLLLGSIVLSIYLRSSKSKLPLENKNLLFYLILGFLGLALPFFLISSAEVYIDSGLAGLLMSPMPLITLGLSAIILKDEVINKTKILAFIIAFLGLIVLFGPENLLTLGGSNRIEFLSQVLVLIAACCYGTNAVLSKLAPKIDVTAMATGVCLGSLLFITPLALFYDPFFKVDFTYEAIIAIIIQGVFGTAIANILFFKIIELKGPIFLSLLNFMIPPIAFFTGVLFLNEKIKVNALLALLMILLALYINYKSSKITKIN
ncbi:DMT family transporter [Pelagibacteraceae bacterium]|nr:DMT family transporter [Pelagibacteraceae bacterium]